MKIRVISVGRDRTGPLVEASKDYGERIRRYVGFELVEVRESPLRKGSAPDGVRRIEAERIEEALGPGVTVAIDERGRSLSSEQWAAHLDRWRGERPTAQFMIGGPVGLARDLVRRADDRWSLGPLTLPHRLARVVVLEQLYRALTILRGEPYHK